MSRILTAYKTVIQGSLYECDILNITAGDLALNVQPVRNSVVSGILQEMEQRMVSAI